MAEDSVESIVARIVGVRGLRVMLDADLAKPYCVSTIRLNEQVKRNRRRLPSDFMFRINRAEWAEMLSQNAITSQRHRRLDRLPFAFTEHGCLMLSNVLRSPRAVAVSVTIVRAFVTLRTVISAHPDLATKVDTLGRELAKHRSKLVAHDAAILKLLAEIRALTRFPEAPRRGIGYTADWSEGRPP